MGSLFLKRGNLRQGLTFGLISFAVFAVIFAVIVVWQNNAPSGQGLFASGIGAGIIVRSIPWILMFCFVNAFMEELWFRGVSLGKLAPVVGRTAAVIVTALVFGSTHSAATYITPVQMLLFASIWGSVFFHAGYDLLVILPVLASQ